MERSLICAGFGGQGALFAGQVLAYAAMETGLEVTWIPSYGPEMRGGTAHCTVIVADEPIGSPLVRHPEMALVLNLPSALKYAPLVKPGGLLVVNSSLVPQPATATSAGDPPPAATPQTGTAADGPPLSGDDSALARADIRILWVPGNAIAEKLGAIRLTNMVLLGALLEATQLVPMAVVERVLTHHLPQRHQALLDANFQALREGTLYGAAHLQGATLPTSRVQTPP